MKQTLIYFALLYGEATTAVFLIALIAYWVSQPKGIEICAKYGFSPVGCGALLSCIVLVLTGIALIGIIRRLRQSNRTNSTSDKG